MTIIPKQLALQRWDTLSEEIREVMTSEESVEILERIAESEHVPKEKIKEISRIAGYVFMGFLHAEEVAGEIKEALGIDIKIAQSISQALNSRLFAPYKNQLEKIYSPVPREGGNKTIDLRINTLSSKEVNFDLKSPKIISSAEPTIKENVESQTAKERPGGNQLKPKPILGQKDFSQPAPKIIDEIEKIKPVSLPADLQGGVAKAKEIPAPFKKEAPIETTRPVNIQPLPAIPIVKPETQTGTDSSIVEEIKKIEKSSGELIGVLKQREAVAEEKNGPRMIYEQKGGQPVNIGIDFKIEPPKSQFSSNLSKDKIEAPAKIEIRGFNLEKNKPEPAKSEVIKAPKVVHYSAFQTPLESPPIKKPLPPISVPEVKNIASKPVAPTNSLPRSLFLENLKSRSANTNQINYKEEKKPLDLKPTATNQGAGINPKVETKNFILDNENIDLENLRKLQK